MRSKFIKTSLILGCSALLAGELQENHSNLKGTSLKTAKKEEKDSSSRQPIAANSSKNQKNSPHSTQQEDSFFCTDTERVQFGVNYTYAWITPEQNNTTTGSLGGFQAIYEHCPTWSIYAGAAFSYRIGSTSNEVTTRDLQDFNPQVRLGYTFTKDQMLSRATVFSGLGARYMAETVTVNTASLDFDYTEFYIPLGFLLERKMTSWMSVGFNFQWMPQIFPVVFIEPLTGARWDLTYQLLNFFVEIPIRFMFKESRYSLSVNPFFESWRNGASTAETLTGLGLNLPGNEYIFTGVNLNFMASF